MKHLALLAILSLAFVLAGCNYDVPPGDEYDWCYAFDFTTGALDGLNITDGQILTGQGILNDAVTGLLTVSYQQPAYVNAAMAIVTAKRKFAYPGNPAVNIAANYDIFGIRSAGAVSFQIPSEAGNTLTNIPIPQTNTNISANVVNISLFADQIIEFQTLSVMGYGSSPFPSSNCTYDQTPTPTPSPNATNTHTPAPTSTPTISPTPTITPTAVPCAWVHELDFTAGQNGFGLVVWDPSNPTLGSWSFGTGWLTANAASYSSWYSYSAVYIDRTFSSTISNASSVTMSMNVTTLGSNSYNARRVVMRFFNGVTDAGICSIIPLNSTGILTCTKSPSPFNRILLELTPAACNLNAGCNAGSWAAGAGAITRLTFSGTGINPFTGVEQCPTSTPTQTFTASATVPPGTATSIPPASSTPIPPSATITPRPLGSPTIIATNATGIPPTATWTRFPINTPPQATFPPPPTSEATYPPLTATYIYSTVSPTVGGTPSGTPSGTYTPDGTSTIIAPSGTPFLDPDADDFADGIGQLGGNVFGSLTNIFNIGFGWLGEVRSTVETITNAWETAPARSLPSMPKCSSDRLASELCAIYYILTYTILSGAVGSLIVPLGLVALDLWIVFAFIKMGRAVLARFKTSVED